LNGNLSNREFLPDPDLDPDPDPDPECRYYKIHMEIFGDYKGRFPPRPLSAARLRAINVTGVDFLLRNELHALQPLFYQFFDMQGMGLLSQMSAYYMLKWCSPRSLQAGGFGNDKDAPLAMLQDGYGALVDALATEVQLEVRLQHSVKRIERSAIGGVKIEFEGTYSDEKCDILALSGPIPIFVRGSVHGNRSPNPKSISSVTLALSCLTLSLNRGSVDGTRSRILTTPSTAEKDVFGPMKAMQFLVSLIDFGSAPSGYKALEFWPEDFPEKSEVIVSRDVGYAEEGKGHRYR